MEEKSVEQIKKLIADFRLLATYIQKDNQIKSKNLKETNQVSEACKKEYQKLFHENETLKKSLLSSRRNYSNVKKSLKKQICLV